MSSAVALSSAVDDQSVPWKAKEIFKKIFTKKIFWWKIFIKKKIVNQATSDKVHKK
jgi:hypothetical protein